MHIYDIRSAQRLQGLRSDFKAAGRVRKPVARDYHPGPVTGVMVRGGFFGRVLEPDRETIARDWDFFGNAATTEGLNLLLDGGFRGGTVYTSWYVGLINNTSYSGVVSGDTLASHSGWSEYTGYTEGTRRQWSPAAAANGTIVNGTAMSFTNGGSSANIIGCLVATDSTKGGTTGKIWATAVEASARALSAAQVFQVYYELDLVPQS